MNALIAALYAGYALYIVFPFASTLEQFGATSELKFGIDVILYVVFCGVFYYVFKRFIGHGFYRDSWVKVVIGILLVGFLLAVLYHTFAIDTVFNFPSVLSMIFAPKEYFFWWFVAPLAGLLILAR